MEYEVIIQKLRKYKHNSSYTNIRHQSCLSWVVNELCDMLMFENLKLPESITGVPKKEVFGILQSFQDAIEHCAWVDEQYGRKGMFDFASEVVNAVDKYLKGEIGCN